MNIGSLFLSLGIKGDTKSLDDAIKKVETLKKQTQELNKALKETKANSKLDASSGAKIKTPKESVVLREEAAVAKQKLSLAKTELGFVNLKEKAETKQDKEQKKREKDREKSTRDFFNQVDKGFSFIAKAFTGGLLAGGIGGYITSQAANKVSLSASLKQYGIDPEASQRYANVFRTASGGQVGDAETNNFIANLSEQIAQGLTTNPEILSKFALLGIDPRKVTNFDSALKEIREYSKSPNYNQANLTSLLGRLGVPKEFAPAFGKGFSDNEFNNAFNNANISTNAEVKAATDLNIKFSQLGKDLDVLSGKLLKEFAPAIDSIITTIQGKLTPENIEKAGDIATGLGAGYLATKAAKTAFKYGKAGLGRLGVVGAGGYGLYEGLSYLADENERLYFPAKYKARMKKEEADKVKDKKGLVADFRDQPMADRFRGDSNYNYPQEDIDATLGINSGVKAADVNVNTTVNINAGSVDSNTAPYIARQINDGLNNTFNKVNGFINSKYPTLSTPK